VTSLEIQVLIVERLRNNLLADIGHDGVDILRGIGVRKACKICGGTSNHLVLGEHKRVQVNRNHQQAAHAASPL
jgi:hypothetical protein